MSVKVQIDNATPTNGDNGIGTLQYAHPDGSVVVTHLALDEVFNTSGIRTGCALTGTAIGG